MYYAVMRATGRLIAQDATYLSCSQAAKATGVWDMAPGTVAPYYLTTQAPEPKPEPAPDKA